MQWVEDLANWMTNWYVWVPCSGFFTLLLTGAVVLVLVLVSSKKRPRRTRRDWDD